MRSPSTPTGQPSWGRRPQTIRTSRASRTPRYLTTIPTTGVLTSDTVWLAMNKVGARYTTYYSTDGTHFTPVYNVGASLSNVKVGLFAWNGPATTNDLKVSFQHFHIIN